jgi:hypothetical protein
LVSNIFDETKGRKPIVDKRSFQSVKYVVKNDHVSDKDAVLDGSRRPVMHVHQVAIIYLHKNIYERKEARAKT